MVVLLLIFSLNYRPFSFMRRSRAALLICIGLILLSSVFTSCRNSLTADESPNILTVAKLNDLMVPVKSWVDYSSKGYSSNDWANLVAAAKVVQKCDPKSVERALRQYQLQGHPEKDFYDMLSVTQREDMDSKLFLLMRVVFKLPTSVPERDCIMGGGWVPSRSLINSDHTLNQSWPIKWEDSRPSIIASYRGMEGIHARYDASWEYPLLLRKYPMRDLSTFGVRVSR